MSKKAASRKRITWHSYLRFYEHTGKLKKVTLGRGGAVTARRTLKGLVDRAQRDRIRLKAIGSGHSCSDITRSRDLLVSVDGLDSFRIHTPNRTSKRFRSSRFPGKAIVEVGAGITIKNLHSKLRRSGRGLKNMGTYDGQTIVGAISTSTHGSGHKLTPFPDMVLSIVIVASTSEGGRVLRIEPRNGITNPDYREAGIDELIQDDDTFHSVQVTMGCMGIIESVILDVDDDYFLRETIKFTTWEEFCRSYLNNAPSREKWKALIANHRHLELYVAPHSAKRSLKAKMRPAKGEDPIQMRGEVPCLIIRRKRMRVPADRKSIGKKRSWFRKLGEGLSTPDKNRAPARDRHYNGDKIPFMSVLRVYKGEGFPSAFKAISRDGDVYADYYNKVFEQGGSEIGGYGIEFSVPIGQFKKVMNRIIRVAEKNRDAGRPHTGPVGVRFVKKSGAYMSQFFGRDSVTFEVTMLRGTKGGRKSLEILEKELLALPGVRLHWGLQLGTLKDGSSHAKLDAMYPKFDTWYGVARRFNFGGVFNNAFTRRLGIDVKRVPTARRL